MWTFFFLVVFLEQEQDNISKHSVEAFDCDAQSKPIEVLRE